MKKVFYKILEFLGTIIGILLGLLAGLCFVLLLPLDYIKYKRSLFYKIEHRKYKLFAASGMYFELYNEIAKNNLPITYIFNPKNESLECGWFVHKGTLIIIPGAVVEYCSEDEKWLYHEYSSIPIEEYIKQEIQEINELLESDICSKAVILLDADQTENADEAKQENYFLVYDDNPAETLKAFCEDDNT